MSAEEKLLLRVGSLFFFATGIAGIFLSIFLFKLGGLFTVVEFGLVGLMGLFIIYFISGILLKKYSSSDFIKVGLLLFTIFYGLVFILKQHTIDYIIYLGLLNGIAAGFYWSGNNLTQYIETHEHTRNEFFSKQLSFYSIASSIGPVLGGFIIYLFGLNNIKDIGYAFVFLITTVLMSITFYIASRLPKHSGVQFSFMHLWRHQRIKKWNMVLSQQFLFGLYDIAFMTISGILFFIILKGEFAIGFVNTVSTALVAATYIIGGKLLNKYKYAYLLGMIFSPIGLLVFALQQNVLGIVVLLLLNFTPLLSTATSKSLYDIIDSVKMPWQSKYHFLVERDSVLGIARIMTYCLLLLFFNQTNQIEVAQKWIFIIPIIPFLIGVLQYCLDKHIELEGKTKPEEVAISRIYFERNKD